ncbi:MAG: hypothetical protein K2X86_14000 [Cytophagaceae bacterium]|nr:hypothetical protein [Cytophagaceae bacterium]
MKKLTTLIISVFIATGIISLIFVLPSFKMKVTQEPAVFNVFTDKWENGIPTGFMGEKNGTSLKLDDAWKTNPYKGEKCIKFAVDNSENWRGIHIQFTGAWNVSLDEKTKLADLTGYDKLEFYARAETKDNSIYVLPEIGVGGGGGAEDKKNDTFIEIGPEWGKHTLSLKGMDLKRMNTLLYMVLPEGTLYMDEIRFVKKK